MELFDTHCHLNFEVFNDTVSAVVQRAFETDVVGMVVVGTTLENSQRAVELAGFQPGVYASVGVHPHKLFAHLGKPIEQVVETVSSRLRKLASQPKVVAVGEIGFDRWAYRQTRYANYQVSPEFIALQKAVFRVQLEVALEFELPLIFHNRQAATDLLSELSAWIAEQPLHREFLYQRAVFHCCEPDQRLLEFAKQHSLFVGVAGDVTYDPAKQAFVKTIPDALLLLETDAPFFVPRSETSEVSTVSTTDHTPLQAKGAVCEPSYIIKTAQTIAKIRQKSTKFITEQTTQNAHIFLGV